MNKIYNIESFNYLNYSCKYKYKIENEPLIDYSNTNTNICFYKLFDKLSPDIIKKNTFIKMDLSIYINKNDKLFIQDRYNNICIFTKREIKYFLNVLKSIYNIEYELLDYIDENNNELYEIKFNINNTPFQIKTICTYIRYLFEAPYNIILREAINIKQQKIKGLYRLNLIELIIIIHNLYASPEDDHSLFKIFEKQDSNIIFIESKNNLRNIFLDNDKNFVNTTFCNVEDNNISKIRGKDVYKELNLLSKNNIKLVNNILNKKIINENIDKFIEIKKLFKQKK